MLELRKYQEEDVAFLVERNAAGIFNEQRTGKTPTVLTALMKKGCNKNIIIAPASTLPQWKAEYERWTGDPCVILHGSPTKIQKALTNWTHGAVVSYGTFKTTSNSIGLVDTILAYSPDAMVCDEAHRMKDPSSAVAKAIHKCRNSIPVRYALTGTPAPNKQHEIFSILKFLMPERFNSYWKFIDEYFQQFSQFGGGRTFRVIGNLKSSKQAEFMELLQECSIQRKRIEVMPWLPAKDYDRVLLEPTKEQTKYLKELKDTFETEHIITQGVLDRLIRLRQICLAPELLELKGKSPKIEYILDYLNDYPDTPTIIFSKFTSFLDLLAKQLEKKKIDFGMIVGRTPIETRRNFQNRFQNGKLNVIIIQIDAGKEGLTLDRAETCIFCDKYPPAGDIQQAEDRFVATTLDKKDKPHTIKELMMKGTYDEQLYELVLSRASDVDVINNYKLYLQK